MYDVDSYPTILALKHDLPAVLYDGSFEEVVAFALKMHKASPVELKQPSDHRRLQFFQRSFASNIRCVAQAGADS